MLRYTTRGGGVVARVELNIHKHYIPPFFESLVRLKEKTKQNKPDQFYMHANVSECPMKVLTALEHFKLA